MLVNTATTMRAVVFDLDGTLYFSEDFAAAIQNEATSYMASILGINFEEALLLMSDTRASLNEESGTAQTLSAVCSKLGGNIKDLHAHFEKHLHPEACLLRDERVVVLLKRLSEKLDLYLYTNNNRNLTIRIVKHLGLGGMFENIFCIDDEWRAKPDEQMLEQVLAASGMKPDEVLFVGDRYDVDLRLPEQKGCPVFLSQTIEQLLRLNTLL